MKHLNLIITCQGRRSVRKLGGPGKCWHLGLRSRGREAPPCEAAGRAGEGAGGVAPPAKGVRGLHPRKIF
jgi:hypothetical protein